MLKRALGVVAVVAIMAVAWFFLQGPGKDMLHKSDAPPVDTGTPAPAAPQPEAAQPAPQPEPQQAPANTAPPPAPAPTQQPEDASQNRGMKFLLNQGKGN